MIDFIQSETQFFIFCLTTLFTLINPIGIAPLLLVMTERFSKQKKITIAWKGSFTAFFTLILFSILGSFIFNVFSITIEAFQIMGGILFFRNGLRMLGLELLLPPCYYLVRLHSFTALLHFQSCLKSWH